MENPSLQIGDNNWAAKDGSILGYNIIQDNYLPQPIDFTRASTATRVNESGLIESVATGVPRIDYTSGFGKLLLEPQRTNIITYSNSNNLNFALDNVSMAYNSVVSPDGTTNGILFKQTGTNNSNSAYNYGLTTADGTYTYSIFLKASDSESIRIYSSNGAATLTQDFNPQTMTEGILAGNLNLNFQDYGGGWFRMSFTRTLSSAANHRLSIYPDRNNTQKGLYIYGIQVEVSSYATSYIPTTSGTAVTRLADAASKTGISSLIGQTEGTIFLDINILQIIDTEALGTINSGGYANNITIAKIANIIQFVRNSATQSGSSVVTSGAITNGRHKMAIAYKSGDTAFYLDGAQVSTTQTETFTNGTLSAMRLGSDSVGVIPANQSYNQAILFKTRLTNAELATLTTL
jgi:hypothetical protein